MRILFVHQNFPAQYRHIAAALGQSKAHQVVALGDLENIKRRPNIPGVNLIGYPAPATASPRTHHYVRPLEGAVRRGQAVVRACLELRKHGFEPEVIYAHPGWGEALFLRDLFPKTQITLYCEFYYRAQGADVGFDPEFPSTLDDTFRVRIKNATGLLSLESFDAGLSPTEWQRRAFPQPFRSRIAVTHDGIDTDLARPQPDVEVNISGKGLRLTSRDDVVTYVARNLEPYRGFHVFMRAIPEIQRRRPHAHVLVVGDEGVSYGQALPKGQTYKQRMLNQLDGRVDMSRVHFLGTVPYETLIRLYQVSSAHVYLTYPFVLSWSLLEAMSAGCAIVASRTAPVEEVISDGKNGYLVDFFRPEEIAERVDEVLTGGPVITAVRKQARRTIVARYDLKRVCLPAHLKLLGVK
jgi:glycosyltransferase involved in cell wall biosynthesis